MRYRRRQPTRTTSIHRRNLHLTTSNLKISSDVSIPSTLSTSSRKCRSKKLWNQHTPSKIKRILQETQTTIVSMAPKNLIQIVYEDGPQIKQTRTNIFRFHKLACSNHRALLNNMEAIPTCKKIQLFRQTQVHQREHLAKWTHAGRGLSGEASRRIHSEPELSSSLAHKVLSNLQSSSAGSRKCRSLSFYSAETHAVKHPNTLRRTKNSSGKPTHHRCHAHWSHKKSTVFSKCRRHSFNRSRTSYTHL